MYTPCYIVRGEPHPDERKPRRGELIAMDEEKQNTPRRQFLVVPVAVVWSVLDVKVTFNDLSMESSL